MEQTQTLTQEYAYKPTTHGRAVMAACMALERPLKITRVAFGSGKVEPEVNLADVHALLEYISEGTVAERRHEEDRFYLTVQYANSEHPAVKTFLLSEFMVWCQDPETGEETDLLYGTLGDYRQPVPGYNPAYPPSIFNFPLTLILSDEINVSVSAPSGLVTHGELLGLLDGIGTDKAEVVIPASGWVPDTDTGGAYALQLDIAIAKITGQMIPKLTVHPAGLDTAAVCGLCPAARTERGILRVYAQTMPEAPISTSLTLLDTSYQTSGKISGSLVHALEEVTIPIAGWAADTDGVAALHLDIADERITEKMVPELTVLPKSQADAVACALSASSRTLPGALRVYAGAVPAVEMKASLALLGVAAYSGGGGTEQV